MSSKKMIFLVGARPQFIKLAPLMKVVAGKYNNIIIHTGQHFDKNMSDIFFKQMAIPAPQINLNIAGGNHGEQTGRMLIEIEKVYLKKKPNLVVVFGDTNSTLAGALAASKLHIPVMHIEAGLRSHDIQMPEEQNRIVVDHLSTFLCCPSLSAIKNLSDEGIKTNVFNTGDIMYDAVLLFINKAKKLTEIPKLLKSLNLTKYHLLTLHRASNTDNQETLKTIIETLSNSEKNILFPIHPRTKNKIKEFSIKMGDNIKVIDPVGYLEMLYLIHHSTLVLTDSGGMQKEAIFLKKPCITLRDTTEWTETLECNWNRLVMKDRETLMKNRLYKALKEEIKINQEFKAYGNGQAAKKIADIIQNLS